MAMPLLDIILYVTVFILLLAVVGIWLIYKSNDYKIRIRELTSTGIRVISDTVGKVKRDEDKVEYLKLFKSKRGHSELPIPPAEAIDYDPRKKKKIVECYWSPELGYIYVKDTDKIDGFQPLTTKQRAMMVNQIRKKEARKKSTWKENIPMIVGLGALIVLVVVVLLFWGEFMSPFMTAVARVEALLDRASLCGTTSGTQVITGG